MTSPTYFISDLHLDASRPAVTQALAEFLEERRDAEALYILGDLFEFWIGDDDDSETGQVVADLLRRYAEAGPAVFLMHGNRDFLIGEAYATRCGATLLGDPCIREVGGQRILLMHGDSLCTRDEAYQEFRKLARSPEWQAQILALPIEERRRLAEQLRTVSRDAGSRKAEDIMDVTPEAVEKALRDNHCATLVHGHTHRPAMHRSPGGERWVLGDWEARGWYIRANAVDSGNTEDSDSSEALELVSFPIGDEARP